MTQQLNWRIKLVSGSTFYAVTVHGPLKKKLNNQKTMFNALQTLKHIADMNLQVKISYLTRQLTGKKDQEHHLF